MDWLSIVLICGACILVALYARGVFLELSDRLENLRTEFSQQIASRVLKSDFEAERNSQTHNVDLIRHRVDELENGRFELVRYDDEEEDDEDEDVITAKNAEVALEYDSVNITV